MNAGATHDLRRAVAASLALAILMALPIGGVPKDILLVPFVLLLPGYAVSVAMFPPGAITRGERLLYTLCLSVATAALGGLLWQLLFGLDRFAWAFLVVATVLASAAIAGRRRAPQRPGAAEHGPRQPRVGLPTALAMLLALALAVLAIDTAIDGVHDQRAESHFSALWIVPRGPGEDSVEIGVWNHQEAVFTYRLSVDRVGIPLWGWEGRLGARARKQVILDSDRIPGGGRVEVSLYRDGVLYRSAELETGVGT